MSIAIDVLIMVSQLIAIIDPMGALPLIMSMPNIEQTSVFRRALRIIAIAVPTLLIFFAVAGPYILTAFNISIADFRIAGGIVLLVIGIDTLREGAPRTMGLSPEDYVFVPIVTPMLVGPGAITSVMLFSTYYGLPEVIVSIAIASLITYLVIRFGLLIMKVVGVNMLRFIGRFMSLIIMAWAVSLIIQGLKETMLI
ncbi:antibiotic resistance protein MarC [Vulcanisaeta sp. EB80]|uniref:MarC family protein n=1 Tax=Vulcanisaeta sp. EB80 TaxID=1650660 RepID=UPI0009BD5EBD|nr:MarC family protein [Vulcanisaeta sp. EB80]PLC68206.1 antibiotic resistance protein MarC [Vulcanisaeta sp. EB80]